MRIETLTVALRPRTAWEAVELGMALVRRHAAAIWTPWLALTLPVLVLVNLLAWSIGAIWLAGLAMWWLKPLFDRIPLYVLAHAVFGDVPAPRRTLQAQRHWGMRWMPAYLTWRRFGPVRSLYLPVDLLEGGRGEDARHRRRALGTPVYGVGVLLTSVCLHFEFVLVLGAGMLALLFIPGEYVAETARWAWNELSRQPVWLQLSGNAVAWLATTLVEPFFVGAGFGLYLNRRTEIEGWDIEIVLRRLRTRLVKAAAPLLLVLALSGVAMPGHAQQAKAEAPAPVQKKTAAAKGPPTLPKVFGSSLADDRGLREAVKQAYADPSLSPKKKVVRWQPRDKSKPLNLGKSPLLEWLAAAFAAIMEYGLWVLFGLLALALALTSPRWWRWLRDGIASEEPEPDAIRTAPAAEHDALPEDLPSAIRRLWRAGRERDALALLYRGSVESMAARAEVVLVPGATEAECLRASRRLPSADDREAFAQAVRTWQYAAYAHGLPATDDFEALLDTLSQRFAWNSRGTSAGVQA
ncbi:DUF4129 domain-containing protein [Lysobacter niastensis]|uniref:DUF4129 domain-containing protein n=1 Tax=Lysobacter niastensis TaxID=380629 RepID=A0ABS0BAH3_9GAMM|nr:DUF4129 domain-containing protein [Lysobacter niastensis]MBF6025991.1 DUF4129 domain-containing protein [Lysobacter niastensis]